MAITLPHYLGFQNPMGTLEFSGKQRNFYPQRTGHVGLQACKGIRTPCFLHRNSLTPMLSLHNCQGLQTSGLGLLASRRLRPKYGRNGGAQAIANGFDTGQGISSLWPAGVRVDERRTELGKQQFNQSSVKKERVCERNFGVSFNF